MRRLLVMVIAATGAIAWLASRPAAADVVGPTFTLRTLGSGGPALLDTTRGYSQYTPGTREGSNLGTNWLTGTIYGNDTGGSGNEVARLDPTREHEKGATFIDAGMGTTRTYTTGYHYRGTVAGNSDIGNSSMYMGVTFDPYMTTNGSAGVQIAASSGGTPTWREYIPQSASEALGVINEGSYASLQDKSARVTDVVMQDSINSGYGAGHWHGLEMDAFKGPFTATDGSGAGQAGPRLVSRYFFGEGQSNFKPIYVVHANAARDSEPAATTLGTRKAYLRNRSRTSATLVSLAEFDSFVPDVADRGYDMAQDPVTGDLYILSAIDQTSPTVIRQAYLFAIRPTIPDDSTQPMSWEPVDLDPNSSNAYLVLSSFSADLAYGAGITFSQTGDRLYVSVMSAAGGASQAVYALDVARPVPEPATVGFLVLGGGLLIGGAVIRRRRAG